MSRPPFPFTIGRSGAAAALAVVAVAGAVGLLHAQIEGPERGILPIASTGDFEVADVKVDVKGDNAWDARQKGWEQAQRLAWTRLYAKSHDGAKSSLPDSALNGMVSAIVVQEEEIGPKRYRATLGVVFDRARAGQILGLSGNVVRSAPLLVVPVMVDAGTAMVFEQQTEWQRAWARARLGDSTIDYVRPSGAGNDSLILTAGQIGRRNREWWRAILDQFGAADIVIPVVRLERSWPGGPVQASFVARYGPDNKYLGSFKLKVNNPDAVPKMLEQGVARIDRLYMRALAAGRLRPDTSLIIEEEVDEEDMEEIVEEIPIETGGFQNEDRATTSQPGATPDPVAATSAFTLQFATPDAAALNAGEANIRGIPGVQSANTTSLALGGTSVMQVRFAGDAAALRAALASRGWQVSGSGSVLNISR